MQICDLSSQMAWGDSNWNSPGWMESAIARSESLGAPLSILSLLSVARHPRPQDFRLIGEIRLTVRDFDVKFAQRNIQFLPAGETTGHELPLPVQAAPMPTRWDIRVAELFADSGGKQCITLRILLDDPLLTFLWTGNFPITVKNRKSQLMMANPAYDGAAGRWIAVDLLFDPADPRLLGTAEYNIGLIVTDRVNPAYKLPVIIDPRSENRG